MNLFIVRHAHAGSRSSWSGLDAARPLSKKGRKQAAGIADQLEGGGIGRLVSSPSLRCVQTLEPLAERLSLSVEADSRLLEGAGGHDALALAEELRAWDHQAGAVVCSHGDVIPEVLHCLRDLGVHIEGPGLWPKASAWLVTGDGHRWTAARYLPPPAI